MKHRRRQHGKAGPPIRKTKDEQGFVPPTETNVHGGTLCFIVMGPPLLQRWRLAAVGSGYPSVVCSIFRRVVVWGAKVRCTSFACLAVCGRGWGVGGTVSCSMMTQPSHGGFWGGGRDAAVQHGASIVCPSTRVPVVKRQCNRGAGCSSAQQRQHVEADLSSRSHSQWREHNEGFP